MELYDIFGNPVGASTGSGRKPEPADVTVGSLPRTVTDATSYLLSATAANITVTGDGNILSIGDTYDMQQRLNSIQWQEDGVTLNVSAAGWATFAQLEGLESHKTYTLFADCTDSTVAIRIFRSKSGNYLDEQIETLYCSKSSAVFTLPDLTDSPNITFGLSVSTLNTDITVSNMRLYEGAHKAIPVYTDFAVEANKKYYVGNMLNVTLSGDAKLYTVPILDSVQLQATSLTNKRGLFIGDSQMDGANGSFNDNNIPTFFAEKTGCYAYNHGVNGANPTSYWNTFIKEIDFSRRFDFAVICLGTNGGLTDTLEADVEVHTHYLDYADTFTGNYCKIIEHIKECNPDTQIFLCIPVDGTNECVASCRTVVPKIAERYHIPVIDIYNECGINDGNRWMYSNDGLHFTIPGYRLIGYYLANQVLAHCSF